MSFIGDSYWFGAEQIPSVKLIVTPRFIKLEEWPQYSFGLVQSGTRTETQEENKQPRSHWQNRDAYSRRFETTHF